MRELAECEVLAALSAIVEFVRKGLRQRPQATDDGLLRQNGCKKGGSRRPLGFNVNDLTPFWTGWLTTSLSHSAMTKKTPF